MEEPTDGTKGEGNYTGVYRSNAEIADWKPIVEGDRKSAVFGMEAKNEEGPLAQIRKPAAANASQIPYIIGQKVKS